MNAATPDAGGTRSSDSSVVLAAERLTKRFGGILAVDDVTISFARGELRCLIGPNGAGKSTLFKLLCGVHTADTGSVALNGKDVTRAAPFRRVRHGMGIKFQNPHIYQNLTVGQNLEIPNRRHSEAPYFEIAEELFEWTEMKGLPAAELSHSEMQWLEITLALSASPEVLLLDEPTAGMTPEDTRRTAAFVRRLNQAGLTLVVVEHDMAFVKEIAQTVTVLHQGRLFAEGSFAEISNDEEVRRIYLGQVREEP